MKCFFRTLYYTAVYGLKRGEIISGHHLQYTGKVWFDYWLMECETCGRGAACEVGPDAEAEMI